MQPWRRRFRLVAFLGRWRRARPQLDDPGLADARSDMADRRAVERDPVLRLRCAEYRINCTQQRVGGGLQGAVDGRLERRELVGSTLLVDPQPGEAEHRFAQPVAVAALLGGVDRALVRGPGIGDSVIAPEPRRPYTDEVGADPGRLRIGLLDVHPRGDFLHEDCVAAVRAAASLLEGLGHTVEPAWPACLADASLPKKFMTLWATQMAMAARGFGETLGREVTADDIEPVNWVLVLQAQRLTAVDYAAAQAAGWAFRRALQQWWADGWDLLLTPTVAEPPPPLTEFENNPDQPTAPMRRGGRFAAFTPPFNISGQPAISLPLHRNAEGLPIGVQLAAAYGREDVLIRLAAQLESAHPWPSEHPAIP